MQYCKKKCLCYCKETIIGYGFVDTKDKYVKPECYTNLKKICIILSKKKR